MTSNSEAVIAKSPQIAGKFSNTDFRQQKLMLRESLLEMICFDCAMPGTREEIERLARLHRELEVSPEMYSMWLDALCEAVAAHDPEYTPDLARQWREAMRSGIELMIGKSSGHGTT